VSAATGIFVLNPLTKKLTAAAEREGFGSPTVQRYLRMVLVVARSTSRSSCWSSST